MRPGRKSGRGSDGNIARKPFFFSRTGDIFSNVFERLQSAVGGNASVAGDGACRRRKIFALLVLLVVCCYGGWHLAVFGIHKVEGYLATVRVLPVEHLEISGNSIVPAQKIISAAQIVEHKTTMLGVSEKEIRQRLKAVPWIRSVEVKRSWPASVVIEVEEEEPLALLVKEGEKGQEFYYIDHERRVFLPIVSGGWLDFPVITGLFAVEQDNIRERVLAEALVFLRKVKRNNPYLPLQSISEIHCTEKGELVVYMVEYPFPVFLGKGNIGQKYHRLIQVLKSLYKSRHGRKKIETVSYIQMEYLKDKVLVATAQQEDNR